MKCNVLRVLTVSLTLALVAAPGSRVSAEPPAHSQWEMVFRDEFEGDTLNWDVWASQAGPAGHILSSRWPENVQVKDGLLRLITRKEKRAGQEWTSGNVWVKNQQFSYGYFEARYRYGAAPGLNNAFWLWRNVKHGTPGLIEIDINEGHFPNELNMTLHLHSDGPEKRHYGTSRSLLVEGADLSKEFHTYGAEWNEKEIVFYLDDKVVRRLPHSVAYGANMRLLFSSAVIAWAGEVTDALDGTSMDVDWVRVYRRKGPAPDAPATPVAAPTPLISTAGRSKVLLRQDFETVAEGALPAGWCVNGGAPAVASAGDSIECLRFTREGDTVLAVPVVAKSEQTGRKSLRLRDVADFACLPFPAQKGRVQVTFDVLATAPWSHFRLAFVGPEFDPARKIRPGDWGWIPQVGPYLAWQHMGYVTGYYDNAWHDVALMESGIWTRVRLVLDTATQTFDCYVGEEGRLAGSGKFRTAQDALAGILFFKGEEKMGVRDLYVDNVAVTALE